LKAILGGKVKWNVLEDLCPGDAFDFVQRLLKLDSKERFSAEEALNHPWMTS